ncbi:uroporphyrinogen-III synthase [Yersinia canariae]|uniref:Uroporphyrinogen-III synthase n=1 Tax=Yersinia canariae TaxID=2607663 RepID=A0A857EVX3_9GAMM|nr:uroporphyrinogen-III synthase [Yersinia canariae]QHB30912.1 uroporphyrinogen-III synthase [Yersinia canariae]
MTILVTRPSPSGEQLVSRLRALGRVAYHAPLIDFSPGNDLPKLPALLQNMQAGDLVFALSQNAIRYANPLLKRNNLSWPAQLSYYAIGRNTALALHTASRLHVTYPPTGETSEMLLSLPDLQNLAGKKALLLRGNGGRELLGESLTERGATVTFCECYQRSPIFYDGSEQSAHWQRSGVDILVVTSGEMLQQIYTLVPDYYRSSWLLRCRLVVVSDRLAALAAQMGWSHIRVAENADNDALIRALQDFQ